MADSYYLQQLKKKTPLYPNGQSLSIMQKHLRSAEKAGHVSRKHHRPKDTTEPITVIEAKD